MRHNQLCRFFLKMSLYSAIETAFPLASLEFDDLDKYF